MFWIAYEIGTIIIIPISQTRKLGPGFDTFSKPLDLRFESTTLLSTIKKKKKFMETVPYDGQSCYL